MRNTLILTLAIALSVFFMAPAASAAEAGTVSAEEIQPQASQNLLVADFFERTLSEQNAVPASTEATEGIQPEVGCHGTYCFNDQDCVKACYPIVAVKCTPQHFCRFR